MKIIGPFYGNGTVKNIGGGNMKKTPTESARTRSDSVELSSSAAERYIAENMVEIEFKPRPAEVDSATQKMAANEYNSRDTIEIVANKLFESDVVSDILYDTREASMDSEKIEKISENIANNFYDSQGVRQEIAGKIIDLVDISSLFGNDTNG
jgi:hypothetical protein